MSIEEKFEKAVNVIRNLPKHGSYQPSHELQLRFYAYYKQATEGWNCHPRPGFWDVVGRAKWDAWSKLGNMSSEQAMVFYVEELRKIVETMSYTENVATFLNSLGDFYDNVPAEDLEMLVGPIMEQIRSRPNSPLNVSRDTSPSRVGTDSTQEDPSLAVAREPETCQAVADSSKSRYGGGNSPTPSSLTVTQERKLRLIDSSKIPSGSSNSPTPSSLTVTQERKLRLIDSSKSPSGSSNSPTPSSLAVFRESNTCQAVADSSKSSSGGSDSPTPSSLAVACEPETCQAVADSSKSPSGGSDSPTPSSLAVSRESYTCQAVAGPSGSSNSPTPSSLAVSRESYTCQAVADSLKTPLVGNNSHTHVPQDTDEDEEDEENFLDTEMEPDWSSKNAETPHLPLTHISTLNHEVIEIKRQLQLIDDALKMQNQCNVVKATEHGPGGDSADNSASISREVVIQLGRDMEELSQRMSLIEEQRRNENQCNVVKSPEHGTGEESADNSASIYRQVVIQLGRDMEELSQRMSLIEERRRSMDQSNIRFASLRYLGLPLHTTVALMAWPILVVFISQWLHNKRKY